MARRKKRKAPSPLPSPTAKPLPRLWKAFLWLGEAGFIVTAIGLMYQHFVGNIQLEFVQSLSRGYEFQIKNDTPSDRLIKKFRIAAPLPQQVLYDHSRRLR